MDHGIACVVCQIDPQTASLLVPMAQAAAITTPYLLRNQIRRGWRIVRRGRTRRVVAVTARRWRRAVGPGHRLR